MTQTVRVKLSGSDAPIDQELVEWFQSEFNVAATQFKRFGERHEVEIAENDVRRIVDAAESGIIDDALRGFGEARVQNITQGPKDEFSWKRVRLYEHVPTVTFNPIAIDSVPTADLRALAATIDILVVTTTPIERAALYDRMLPLPGQTVLLEGALDHSTYRLGRFGRYRAAHVECTMSGEGRDGSPLTILDSIQELSPRAIFILGIAFGVDRVKQSLGDVIVAETVVPYELARQGSSIVPRGQPLPCGATLSERFRTRRHDWHLLRGSEQVQVHQGLLLSGAKLIDNIPFRDSLVELFPGAIGGEMEGAGAYAAAARTSIEIILVIHFLRRLARFNEGNFLWGSSEYQNMPLFIISARRDWAALEWDIVRDSPFLSSYLVKLGLSPLNAADSKALIEQIAPLDRLPLSTKDIKAIAKLSGGIPLLTVQWLQNASGSKLAERNELSNTSYATWIYLVEWYFRATWNSFSLKEQLIVLAAMLRYLQEGAHIDEQVYPTAHAEKLGAMSAAFCWWLMENQGELPKETNLKKQHLVKDFRRKAVEIKSLSTLLDLWDWPEDSS